MKTKVIQIGDRVIGGGNPILIQSMCNTKTEDVAATVSQILKLEQAGCDIIRVAVPTMEAAAALKEIKKQIHIPLVADIHFDYRLAIAAMENGADKIRINPGNIGGADRVRAVANACNERKIPIRVGVNSGSVERELLARFGGPTAEAMVESAARHLKMLEEADFENTVLSLKSSDLKTMVAAYRLAAERFDCPLHLGVTEAGTERQGVVKSSIGIGSLLLDGIGDTIRVSLTADPVQEIAAAKDILRALGVKGCGAQIVSCPTCGRTRIDLIGLAHQVEEALRDFDTDCKVAVMGCAVNGPGEAREADLGVAGGDGCGVVFVRGRIVEKVPEEALLPTLLRYLKEWERTDGKLEL